MVHRSTKEIAEAIKNGFKGFKKVSKSMQGEFFKLNERKLDALIKATIKDAEKAERAILRMANDKYRSIIFNAQVYANTGAGTYEQAIDMASKDFLSAGLNCVEYKNGARHKLSDYISMALRTANKRAYLYGEGEKRQEWGISTVIMNKRGNPCPLCLPWVGKVLIDDVWSGGSAKDGSYPLLSTAMAAGLYHPNCRDSHTTYFEGISTPPDDKFTKAELEEIDSNYRKMQKRQYAKKQAEKFERLADNSLDEENKRQYSARAEQWKDSIAEIEVKDSQAVAMGEKVVETFAPAKTIEEAQEYAMRFVGDGYSKIFKNAVDYKGISLQNANEINRALEELYTQYDTPKINGIKAISPTSAQGKKIFSSSDAVAAYSPVEHGIFLNKEVLKNADSIFSYNEKSKEAWDFVMQNVDSLSGSQKELALTYKKAGRALVGDGSVHDYIVHEMGHHIQWDVLDSATNNAMGRNMSKYAHKISGYANASKGEYIAESFVAYTKGEVEILDPVFKKFMDNIPKTNKNIILSASNQEVSANIQFTIKGKSDIISTSKQFGKKIGKHAIDYGLDPSKEEDRNKILNIIQEILDTGEVVKGTWNGQEGICDFYIRGNDVVVTNKKQFVTIMKDGAINSERVKRARIKNG